MYIAMGVPPPPETLDFMGLEEFYLVAVCAVNGGLAHTCRVDF
jgi:hypothetical protein